MIGLVGGWDGEGYFLASLIPARMRRVRRMRLDRMRRVVRREEVG